MRTFRRGNRSAHGGATRACTVFASRGAQPWVGDKKSPSAFRRETVHPPAVNLKKMVHYIDVKCVFRNLIFQNP